MIAKSCGSKSLAGVGPLGCHVPAIRNISRIGYSSMAEQQPQELWSWVRFPLSEPTLLKTVIQTK